MKAYLHMVVLDKEWQRRAITLNMSRQRSIGLSLGSSSSCSWLLNALNRDPGYTLNARNREVSQNLRGYGLIMFRFSFLQLLLGLLETLLSQVLDLRGNARFFVGLQLPG